MNTSPKNLPRFLPTLTEIVHPTNQTKTSVAATPDLEETVWFVMQRVDLLLERRLREEVDAMLRTMLTEQLKTLSASLRQELEPVVRQAVSDAMTLRASQDKFK